MYRQSLGVEVVYEAKKRHCCVLCVVLLFVLKAQVLILVHWPEKNIPLNEMIIAYLGPVIFRVYLCWFVVVVFFLACQQDYEKLLNGFPRNLEEG